MRRLATLLFGGLVLAVAATAIANNAALGPGEHRAVPGDGAIDAPVPGLGELGGPSNSLSPTEMEKWLRGRALFDHDFHHSEGLGAPEMNGDSCRACHHDPVIGGAGPLELNVFRFANDNGGSGPFQNLPGGQAASKLRPPWAAGREEYDPATADVFEQRQTPSLLGAGLIDSIPDAEIMSNEDLTDSNGDKVYGVARILMPDGSTPEVGRFGWKAQVPRLADFLRDAMGGECGITTSDDGRGFALLSDGDSISDPELSDAQLDDLRFFLANLAKPPSGAIVSAERDEGEMLFDTIGCAKCHKQTLMGSGGLVPLYSDLLLHDIMPSDFRGMEETGAPAGMYRTPPLWGNCHTAPYLHDGRAETVHDAIMMHFGEAVDVRQAYIDLSVSEKNALLLFLSDI